MLTHCCPEYNSANYSMGNGDCRCSSLQGCCTSEMICEKSNSGVLRGLAQNCSLIVHERQNLHECCLDSYALSEKFINQWTKKFNNIEFSWSFYPSLPIKCLIFENIKAPDPIMLFNIYFVPNFLIL